MAHRASLLWAAQTEHHGCTIQPSMAAGPLLGQAQKWCACVTSDWVLKTVTSGYRLQFASTPPKLNRVLQSQVQQDKACMLQVEVNSLLAKGAVQIVPPEKKWFLFEVFPGPQERRGSAAHIRPACSEQIHETTQVQKADAHSSVTTCVPRQLVHIHRPEGCILSHPYLPPCTENISDVPFKA